MNAKRAGWAFLWMTIIYLAASLFISFYVPYLGIAWLAFLTELCLLVPALIMLSKGRVQIAEQLHIKGIKPTTALMVLVYHICTYPVVIAMNSFTMAVSDNTALDIASEFRDESLFFMWLFIGLIGPLVEELVFRGILLGGLRTTGRIFSAVVLSAVLFALAHMNINQFSYTIFAGIFWGLLVEATGSLIPSMLCHVTMNSVSVILAYLLQDSFSELDEMLGQSGMESTIGYLATGLTFLVISVFTTMLALLMLRAIALNEGRTGCFENIFRKKTRAERYGSIISVPLIIGICLASAVTVFMFVWDLL